MELGGAYDSILFDLAGGFSLILLLLAGVICIVWDIYQNDDPVLPVVAAMACVVAIGWEVRNLDAGSTTAFYRLIRAYGLASFINITILLSALATVILSVPYLKRIKRGYGEVYALILFATAGAVMLGTANSLVTVFVGLETMSISLYILAGLVHNDEGGIESALKYFLLGAFSTGFFSVRHCAALRGNGDDVPAGARRGLCRAREPDASVLGWHRSLPGWVFVQGQCSAIPHVDTRCLPGGTHSADRVYVDGV